METKFNFNSAICTSKIQSERLLALGLKKETADMWTHAYYGTWMVAASENPLYEVGDNVPAWSLHRLLCLLPDDAPMKYWILDGGNISIYDEDSNCDFFPYKDNVYDAIIDCIEFLIKEGYFNKEYLVDQDALEERCKGVLEYLDYIRGEE